MRRKISEKLKKWSTLKDRKCLVVQGARQVGKTYSIERFVSRFNDNGNEVPISGKEDTSRKVLDLFR
ncbi:hypothetical protein [Butyrivibrio sp. XPD2006]|uniref:hypothetical protein n=1 Tax=Butyrivibrio sp. XPD2006 TaxID=1280668 RepID=UPI00041BEDDC|nr:hypothetical protein [Butyrivibrio sp. XPD2006]